MTFMPVQNGVTDLLKLNMIQKDEQNGNYLSTGIIVRLVLMVRNFTGYFCG